MKPDEASHDFITIVSGFPRSGTSMMMAALEAGSLEILKDDSFKPPDEHNLRGYFECNETMLLGVGKESARWLERARGKGVKVMLGFLKELPAGLCYRILLMKRRPEEMQASWQTMTP